MQTHTFAAVTSATDSAVLDTDRLVNWVDLWIPTGLEFDGSDLTFKSSVDGTQYLAVPGMTVADDETGYIGRFLVFGSKIKFTSANNAGSASTVTPIVRYRAASMSEHKVAGTVVDADSNATFSFGRAPKKLHMQVTGTIDSGTVTLEGSPDGGTTYIPLSGSTITAVTDFRVYDNPSKMTQFRVSWSGAGASADAPIHVVALNDSFDLVATGAGAVVPATYTTMTDAGTPEADGILDDVTATPDQTLINNNFATVVTETNKIGAQVARILKTLQENGLLLNQ